MVFSVVFSSIEDDSCMVSIGVEVFPAELVGDSCVIRVL